MEQRLALDPMNLFAHRSHHRRRGRWIVFVNSFLVGLLAAQFERTRAAEQAASQQPTKPAVLLAPARVFDAVDGKVHEGWVVLVRSNRIAAVGPKVEVKAPTDAT